MELVTVLKLLLVAVVLSPMWGTLIWLLWEWNIRPRLIPDAEIDSLAATMIARHGRRGAEEVAFLEEEQAWRSSRSFEQGKWRRVRKRIERLDTSAKK
jgi:hypothetical protein